MASITVTTSSLGGKSSFPFELRPLVQLFNNVAIVCTGFYADISDAKTSPEFSLLFTPDKRQLDRL